MNWSKWINICPVLSVVFGREKRCQKESLLVEVDFEVVCGLFLVPYCSSFLGYLTYKYVWVFLSFKLAFEMGLGLGIDHTDL